MSNVKRQQYDIAINGQGFILAQDPEKPVLTAKQDQVFSQRIAQGDKTYNDFISWWYMYQTDWYPGFKDIVSFGDADSISDGHYYWSSNIDAVSQPGALQLALNVVQQATFTNANIICGGEFNIGGTYIPMMGTHGEGGGDYGDIYKYNGSSWITATPSGMSGTSNMAPSQINGRQNYAWVHCAGYSLNQANIVSYYNGSSYTDCTANIVTALSGSFDSSRCGCTRANGEYWVFVDSFDTNNNNMALVKCSKANPTAAGDWTVVIALTSNYRIPVAIQEFQGNIYYLLANVTGSTINIGLELWEYNTTNSTATMIQAFKNISIPNVETTGSVELIGLGNLLQTNGVLLFVALPGNKIYTWDGTNLVRIYYRDLYKGTFNQEAYAYLNNGLIFNDDKMYSGNLVIVDESGNGGSNTTLHNWIKDAVDTSGGVFIPLWADHLNNIWGIDNQSPKKLYSVTYQGSNYKGATGANYLVYNNFDLVSGIDKLAHSLNSVFKTLATGQIITWQYLLGELTPTTNAAWTTLGTASYSVDGAITNKTLYFPDNTIFKKIWVRVLLDGPGSSTPVLYDGPILAFLPMPDYKMHWNFTVKAQNKMKRKDDSVEEKDALWLRNLLQNAWLTKSVLSYEDFDSMVIDYVADSPLSNNNTTINVQGSTDSFPEVGRLLIETEEIFYTGKTKTSFLNCIRGSRSTNAVTHNQQTAISMARRVIIRDYQETLLLANQPLNTEYHISLALQEV